jgi:MFS family permease
MAVIKTVFSQRNILVLSITGVMAMSFMMLTFQWWSLYQLELGATPEIVGATAMLDATIMFLFQLPGGMLADKFGRKKVIVVGWILRSVGALVLIFARTWQQLIPGSILQNAGMSISMPAFQALIAESLPYERRGAGFGAYRLITNLPMIFVPILSGMYMDYVGVAQGMMTGFYLSVIVTSAATVLRAKFLKETMRTKEGERRATLPLNFKESLSSLRVIKGSILAMLIVSAFSLFALRLIMPFQTVYAVDVKGYSKTQWGLVSTVIGIISTVLSLPGGMLSDRFGRRPLLLIAEFTPPANSFGLVLLPEFNQVLLLNVITGIGAGLGGVQYGGPRGGPAWQALMADLVPSKDRGKVMGFMETIAGVPALPASVIGGFLYNDIGPDQLFLINVLIGLVPPFLLYFFVKDPKVREK